MKRPALVLLVVLAIVGAFAIEATLLRGTKKVQFRSFEKERVVKVKAPMFPFRTGNLKVVINSEISEELTLEIRSNYGRDISTLTIPRGSQHLVSASAEAWVDDLEVIVPSAAASGYLNLSLFCGRQE